MTVDELVAKLKTFNGHLPVVVEDGMDPSDLREVSTVEVEDSDFFHGPGFKYSRNRPAVRLS